MNIFVPSRVYDAVIPASQASEDKMYQLCKSCSLSICVHDTDRQPATFDRGAPYFDEPDVIYMDESHPWIVGRTYKEIPPTDISPIRISTSMGDGNKQLSFYVVIRGRGVGVLLDRYAPFILAYIFFDTVLLSSVAAISLTNGVTDGYKFKTRSQRKAVEQFNQMNRLGEVKICRTRDPRP